MDDTGKSHTKNSNGDSENHLEKNSTSLIRIICGNDDNHGDDVNFIIIAMRTTTTTLMITKA